MTTGNWRGTMTTLIITDEGHIAELTQDQDEWGRWRWLHGDEDTETSGGTYEEAVEAGLMAWPGSVVIVTRGAVSPEAAALAADTLADEV